MRMPDRRLHMRETVGIVDSNVSARESEETEETEETEESMLKYDDRSSDIIYKQIFLHLSYVKVKYLCLPNKPCGEKKRMRMPDRRLHMRETVGIVDSNVSARESEETEETEESMLKYDDRNAESTLSVQPSTSATSSDSTQVTSLLRSEHWPSKFPIPCFSYDVDLKLQKANEEYEKNGKSLTVSRDILMEVLGKLAEAIYIFKAYPKDTDLKKVASALIEKHPCLKRPGSETGCEGWTLSLKNKMQNYCQKLCELGCAELILNRRDASKQTLKRPRRSELNFLPDIPTGFDEEALENERKWMEEEVKKKDVNMRALNTKMDFTFSLRRREVYAEFRRINHLDLKSTFLTSLDNNSRGLLKLFRAKVIQRGDCDLETLLDNLDEQDSIGLEKFIQLSIRCATRMQACLQEHQDQSFSDSLLCRSEPVSSPEPANEPMDIENSRLTPSKRRRRLTLNLCLYCGMPGHVISACPTRPPRPMVSAILPSTHKMKPLTTVVNLTAAGTSLTVVALLDSVSAGNFISGALCRHLNLKTSPSPVVYQISSITGKPLSRKHVRRVVGPLQLQVGLLHVETIHLLVLEESTADVVLGRPWLEQHNPTISWKTGEILKWCEACFSHCISTLPVPRALSNELPICTTSIESPVEKRSIDIPECYAPFSDSSEALEHHKVGMKMGILEVVSSNSSTSRSLSDVVNVAIVLEEEVVLENMGDFVSNVERRGLDWISAEELAHNVGFRSERLIKRMLDDLEEAIPVQIRDFMKVSSVVNSDAGDNVHFPELHVSIQKEDWLEDEKK
ncbi:Retrotransposon-derived protein PEG10 [Anabarilius grahami]|uniref:Retrotransposon-derived protein PEG10 n=1 Tax=Anabarilius grahami TaxID=495550 RepID=A0A3N0Z4B0_ANAGA|nr:Retrotransposon-derived protein PEG10 [Anabarilius grahami]